ncbi:MAG: MFS transporter [Fimbriimonadales bacterium]
MSTRTSSVLQYRGFKNLFVGQLISQFGDVLYFLVFLWWAGKIGGPAGAGLVGACSVGTAVVLSLYAGTVADRFDRRKILFVSDIFCGTALLGLVALVAVFPHPPLWALCVFAVVLKCGYVFQMPARGAAIPRLVPEDRLLEANSLNMTFQTMMPLVGYGLGAFALGAIFKLSATLAYELTFTVNALTFFLSAWYMAKLPAIPPERSSEPKHPWAEAKAGLKFVFGHPIIRTATLVFTGFQFFVGPFMTAYIASAQTTFVRGVSVFGVVLKDAQLLALLEIGFFAGFVIGSAMYYRRPLTRAGIVFPIFMALASLAIVPLGFTASVWVFWGLNFVCGILMPFGVIPVETLLQQQTPDQFRGRMNAAVGTLTAASAPIAMALGGVFIKLIGLDWTYAAMGIGLLVSCLAGLLSPAFRNSTVLAADRRVQDIPATADAEPAVA